MAEDNNDSKSKLESQHRAGVRRRRLIKGTIATGVTIAVVDKWVTPVIRSVTLPAHAETSGYTENTQDDNTFFVDSRTNDDSELG